MVTQQGQSLDFDLGPITSYILYDIWVPHILSGGGDLERTELDSHPQTM